MISIIKTFFEATETGSVLLQKNGETDKAYTDGSPVGDKLDSEIKKNKFTGPSKTEGVIDQSVAPPNPEVAYQYVNTPLSRITNTRI